MKNRLVRVRELIKRELGAIIVRDIRFDSPLVTIFDVDITPDLKHAHVFISAMGSANERRAAITVLEQHRSALQVEMSKRVILKNTPMLHFKLDDSIERGDRVLHLMDELGLDEVQPEPTYESDDSSDPADESK